MARVLFVGEVRQGKKEQKNINKNQKINEKKRRRLLNSRIKKIFKIIFG
jgi:hypothetical protein